jgi:hypothetical protein
MSYSFKQLRANAYADSESFDREDGFPSTVTVPIHDGKWHTYSSSPLQITDIHLISRNKALLCHGTRVYYSQEWWGDSRRLARDRAWLAPLLLSLCRAIGKQQPHPRSASHLAPITHFGPASRSGLPCRDRTSAEFASPLPSLARCPARFARWRSFLTLRDGLDAHVIEPLYDHCAMNGSRAAWKPLLELRRRTSRGPLVLPDE